MSRASWLGLGLIVLVACGGDSVAPDPLMIGGTWDYAYEISNAEEQVSCNGQGTITLGQNGEQFTGQGNGAVVCGGPGGQIADEGAVSVSGGSIDGRSVSFRFPLFEASCNASGSASGDPPNNMQGSLSCSLSTAGQVVSLSGNWQASR